MRKGFRDSEVSARARGFRSMMGKFASTVSQAVLLVVSSLIATPSSRTWTFLSTRKRKGASSFHGNTDNIPTSHEQIRQAEWTRCWGVTLTQIGETTEQSGTHGVEHVLSRPLHDASTHPSAIHSFRTSPIGSQVPRGNQAQTLSSRKALRLTLTIAITLISTIRRVISLRTGGRSRCFTLCLVRLEPRDTWTFGFRATITMGAPLPTRMGGIVIGRFCFPLTRWRNRGRRRATRSSGEALRQAAEAIPLVSRPNTNDIGMLLLFSLPSYL